MEPICTEKIRFVQVMLALVTATLKHQAEDHLHAELQFCG